MFGDELEDLAAQCYKEYEHNLKGVKEAFDQFIFTHNAAEKSPQDLAPELEKMLSLRFRTNSPKRPPRVIIVGPPGSGRST